MSVTVRVATMDDADHMIGLLNDIIAVGGTTAHQIPFNLRSIRAHFFSPDVVITCHVATVGQDILGFQSLDRADPDYDGPDKRPAYWAMISTFVKHGAQGQGVGTALFNATIKSAKAHKITAIDATIRADNTAGLNYYTKMGFRQDGVLKSVPLSDGTKVDRFRTSFLLS